MSLRKLPGGRVADRLALPSAELLGLLDAATAAPDLPGDLPSRLLLVTFRRTGERVATPVWTGWADGVAYARTQRDSGKVKRLRNSGRVLVAPCTVRGEPLSAPAPGSARVLPSQLERTAERALRSQHGPVRAACAWIQDRLRVDMCYLAIRLGDPEA